MSNFEFIANNPGDWMFHCHMTHHMMNHMVRHVGPRLRQGEHVDRYLANIDSRPPVDPTHEDKGFAVPGYPQGMKGMSMSEEFMKTIWLRREVQGMRATWPMSVKGLMTTLRVLPDDLREGSNVDDAHGTSVTHELLPQLTGVIMIAGRIVNKFNGARFRASLSVTGHLAVGRERGVSEMFRQSGILSGIHLIH